MNSPEKKTTDGYMLIPLMTPTGKLETAVISNPDNICSQLEQLISDQFPDHQLLNDDNNKYEPYLRSTLTFDPIADDGLFMERTRLSQPLTRQLALIMRRQDHEGRQFVTDFLRAISITALKLIRDEHKIGPLHTPILRKQRDEKQLRRLTNKCHDLMPNARGVESLIYLHREECLELVELLARSYGKLQVNPLFDFPLN